MKKKLAILLCAGLLLGGCAAPAAQSVPAEDISKASPSAEVTEEPAEETAEEAAEEPEEAAAAAEEPAEEAAEEAASEVTPLDRPMLLSRLAGTEETSAGEEPADTIVPSVAEYTIEPDFSNVINAEAFSYMPEGLFESLMENGFAVGAENGHEFFEIYENNRYGQYPNFVTVDSMLHTYHLYFAHLLRQTEKKDLVYRLESIGTDMLENSIAQAAALKGTEWEDAALMNEAFFAVGVSLLNPETEIPDEVREAAAAELTLIDEQDRIAVSPMFDEYEDYTQYKPRGYYEGDETLEKYFRAMMWYGRRNFIQSSELTDRAALLMCLSLNNGPKEDWEALYAVTSFFAGTSDDNGYCEYLPLIEAAYGSLPDVEDLPGTEKEFAAFHKLTGKLAPPAINSVPMDDDEGRTDKAEVNKGFRFIGQRFTLDAAIFQQVCYSKVKKNDREEKRLLPTALDVPAAMGSETALEIIREEGMADYPNYEEQMDMVRGKIRNAPAESAQVSLYAGWLDMLNPLLTEKGEGWPFFMQNSLWTKKDLETYLGSWTELKHDTVLYSKQFMAEMGGGPEEEVDERGYVEPEPEVYAKLTALTKKTKEGLQYYDMISQADAANLDILADLSDQLRVISEKELQNILPTDEEFELILTFGGQLEHLWAESVKDQLQEGETRPDPRLYPAALAVDVATDPNGRVLQTTIGNPSTIYVVVPVDGILRIATGSIFNYYEFEQPIDERLTDSDWRKMMGIELNDEGTYNWDHSDVKKPAWTEEYRIDLSW